MVTNTCFISGCVSNTIAPSIQEDRRQLPIEIYPQNFETMVRGINTNALHFKLIKVLPFMKREAIDLISSYLDNRKTLFRLLDHLIDKESIINRLVTLVKIGNWEDPILNQPNIDMYLLEALRRDLLNYYEFSSISLFVMALKTANLSPVVVPVIKEDRLNPTAESLLKESFFCPVSPDLFINKRVALLEERQFSNFIVELSKLPRTERLIFLIPFSKKIENSVVGGINKLGLNIFGKVSFLQEVDTEFWGRKMKLKINNSLLVAPLGMVQAFLNVKFGRDAVKLAPAIGPSPISELRENALNDTRVVGLNNSVLDHLTGLTFPSIADGYDAPGVCFTYHDSCYHSYLSSSIPKDIRRRLVEFSDFIKKTLVSSNIQQCLEREDTFFRKLAFACIDMEHPFFRHEIFQQRPSKYQTFEGVFWLTLALMIARQYENLKDTTWMGNVNRLCQALFKHNKITTNDVEAIEIELHRMRSRFEEMDILPILSYMHSMFQVSI